MKRIFTVFTTTLLLSFTVITSTTLADEHNHLENFEQSKVLSSESLNSTIFAKSENGLDIEVHLRNFRDSDKEKLYRAVEVLREVINSKELKEQILNHKFKDDTTFHQNNNMTNLEIYNHLMTGAENLKPDADRVMNFDLTLYRSKNPWSSVKGYTLPDTMRIWLNKKFYRRTSWTPVDIAANMAHEWIHKMGFGHDFNYNSDRPFSVPYAIGDLVGKVARSMGYQ
jgi:hypothetical protein